MTNDPIPFLDLVTPHVNIMEQLTSVLTTAIANGHFVGGAAVESFEKEFASFCETPFSVGVSSGTDALRFALMAAGIRPGSAVITVPNTFIATTEAITQAGGMPLFVDIDEKTYNMDPVKVAEFLDHECSFDKAKRVTTHRSSGTIVSALIPVHLYGQPADMDSLQEIADAYNLVVIEDACQAHGAEYFSRSRNKWCKAGSLSMAAAFSFYPGKNLGALGEGGAITTSNAALAEYSRMLREHGSIKKYYHPIEGYNGRLDALQAGFLSHKLPLLHGWNEARRHAAQLYNELLSPVPGIVTPFEPKWSRANYHLYIIQTDRRDELQSSLALQGIGTGLHYPLPLHLQKAYRDLNFHEGDFPVAEAAALRIMSLPMYPTLKNEQQERVAKAIEKFANAHAITEPGATRNRLVGTAA